MKKSPPVFPDRQSMLLWNRVSSVEESLVGKKRAKGLSSLETLVADVAKAQEGVHPAIMARILAMVGKHMGDRVEETIFVLSERMGLRDSIPAVVAAGILLDAGSPETAKAMMDRLVSHSDAAAFGCVMGKIAAASGAGEEAIAHLTVAYESDDSYIPTYDILAELEPDKGWDTAKAIALVRQGKPAKPVGSGPAISDAWDLYEIWWEWENGGKGNAKAYLEKSARFAEGDREYVLSAARMSLEYGEYSNAVELFTKVLESGKSMRASVGLAKAHLEGGEPMEAVAVLSQLGLEGERDRRVLELLLKAYAAAGRMGDYRRVQDFYLEEEYVDLDSYKLCIDLLMAANMQAEARILSERLHDRSPDTAGKYVLMSINDMAANRLSSAHLNASRALRLEPNNLEAKRQRANVYLRLGRYKKALNDVNASLVGNRGDLGLLGIKKDILINSGNDLQALDVIKTILQLDPRNAEAMNDGAGILDRMGKIDESYKMYKDSLDLKEDPKLFMEIMDRLAATDRYSEIANLVRTHDDTYGKYPGVWAVRGNAEYAVGDYKEAAESYKRAAELAPTDPSIWHSMGMAEEKAGYMDRAEICYDKAVLLDLDNPLYWISKASAQEAQGNLSGAVASLNRVISESPDNLYALVRKACVMVKAGELADARHFLDLALKVAPNDVAILKMKRDLSEKLGRYNSTINASRSILLLDRRDFPSYIAMAKAQSATGNHTHAVQTIEKGIFMDPSEKSMLLAKADILKRAADSHGEAVALESYLVQDPNNREIKIRLADLYLDLNDRASAESLYRELEAEDPKDKEVAAKKAMAVAVAPEEDAAAVLEDALKKDPENVSLLISSAEALASAGKFKDAADKADRAVKKDPSSYRGYLAKATALKGLGDLQGAEDALQASISVDSTNPKVWRKLGEIQEAQGDLGHSMISYDTAIKLGDESAGAYVDRGRVQEASGALERALNSYSLAVAKGPANYVALEKLGSLQIEMGRESVGVKYLEDSLKHNPSYVPAILARSKVYEKHNDAAGIERMRQQFVNAEPDVEESKEFAEMLTEGDDDIGGYAANLLRVAHESGRPLDDSENMRVAHVPEESVVSVLSYLADIEPRESVCHADADFSRMESLSRAVIVGEKLIDIESDNLITIQAAYVSSGARDVEEAKRLVAYIYAAMTQEMTPEKYSVDVGKALDDLLSKSGDIDTYGIMRDYGLGVYAARTVKMLATTSSVEMHI